MTYTYTRTGVTFIAGERAPGAKEALNGEVVANDLGNTALQGFRVDPLNRVSEVRLDLTGEPPVLHLREALTTALFGETDANDQFVEFENELSRSEREVSGTYTGPGSELYIV